MSYIPYTSGIATGQETIPASPPRASWRRRLWKWFIILLIIGPPVAYIVARNWPVTPEPPLSIISLSNGRELRLVGTGRGREFELSSRDMFDDRLATEDPSRHYSSSTFQRDGRGAAWLVFAVYHPATRSFRPAEFDYFTVQEEGGPLEFWRHPYGGPNGGGSSETIARLVGFDAIPKRSAQLKVKFKLRNEAEVITTMPNPFHEPSAPLFTAEQTPAKKIVDGVEFSLVEVVVSQHQRTDNNRTHEVTAVFPAVKVLVPGKEKFPFDYTTELFDPTGNALSYGALPTGDRVWGVRIEAKEPSNFPFPPERALILGKLPVPGPGQAVNLAVPQKMKDVGVTDILVLGDGRFDWDNTGAVFFAPPGAAKTKVATISHKSSGAMSSQTFGLIFYSRQYNPVDSGKGQLHLRCNDEPLTSGSSGSGSSSSGRTTHCTQHFSNYRGKTSKPMAGNLLEIEMTYPRTYQAEFYFERPKFKGE